MSLIPALLKQRQAELCEFTTSLVYKGSSRTVKSERPCLKKPTKKQTNNKELSLSILAGRFLSCLYFTATTHLIMVLKVNVTVKFTWPTLNCNHVYPESSKVETGDSWQNSKLNFLLAILGFTPCEGDWLDIEYSVEQGSSKIIVQSLKATKRRHLQEVMAFPYCWLVSKPPMVVFVTSSLLGVLGTMDIWRMSLWPIYLSGRTL